MAWPFTLGEVFMLGLGLVIGYGLGMLHGNNTPPDPEEQ